MWQNLALAAAVLFALYGLVAYVILPAVWSHHEHQPGLAGRTMVTATAQGIPGDPLNIGLVGSKAQVVYALSLADWKPADAITLRTSVDIGLSVVLRRPYAHAPVSSLFLDSRKQDLAFERLVGHSADRRHHVRLWRVLEQGVEGREVWLGSASFDRGVGLSHDTLQITHHIDPDLDGERSFFVTSLTGAGVISSTYQVTGAGPTLTGRNGEGDRYYTDGEITTAVIEPALDPAAQKPPTSATPVPHVSTAQGVRHKIWTAILAVARWLGVVPQPRSDTATTP